MRIGAMFKGDAIDDAALFDRMGKSDTLLPTSQRGNKEASDQ